MRTKSGRTEAEFTAFERRVKKAKLASARRLEKIIGNALNNNIPLDLVIQGEKGEPKEPSPELLEATGYLGQLNAYGHNESLLHVVRFSELKKRAGNGHLKVMLSDVSPYALR
ncbi:MAG: hypothetical protein AAB355_02620 [Patescibacteria group bacterium]|mgnify:CR=1 FL=1